MSFWSFCKGLGFLAWALVVFNPVFCRVFLILVLHMLVICTANHVKFESWCVRVFWPRLWYCVYMFRIKYDILVALDVGPLNGIHASTRQWLGVCGSVEWTYSPPAFSLSWFVTKVEHYMVSCEHLWWSLWSLFDGMQLTSIEDLLL